MALVFDNDRPVYMQIVEHIKLAIISGKYKQGEKLPSVRDLAIEYRVNPNTLQRSFLELENLKLVYTQRTNGRYVCEDDHLIEDIKLQFAKEKVNDLYRYMNDLGIKDKDIITYIERVRKGENV